MPVLKIASALGLLLGALSGSAIASDGFPSKPVTLIVNFPPGGVTDGTFRKISEKFKKSTGQSLVIDNRPGRGLAAAALSNARPDGYTIGLVGRTQMALYEQLNGKLTYHPVNDFTWIANVTSSYFGLYTSTKSGYSSLDDVLKKAKAKPASLSYGTSFGHGGLSHVPMNDFEKMAGIEMLHVPFKGDVEAIMLASQNEIDLIVAGGTAIPAVESGKLKLLAWLSATRNPKTPNIPTLKELGYPVEVIAPVGIGGPKGMKPEHVKFFEKTFESIIEDEDVKNYLEVNYQKIDYMNSAQFTEWAKQQLPKEKEIAARFNLTAKNN